MRPMLITSDIFYNYFCSLLLYKFVLEYSARENMKKTSVFLFTLFSMACTWAVAAPVSQTVGSNLTAYDSGMGAINNNKWNSTINIRGTGSAAPAAAPSADFGNCNSLILRCAQPKCANGGCADMNIAMPIAAGCVSASKECKKHGDALTQTIAAQLVASSVAAKNQADAAIATAQAQAAQGQDYAAISSLQEQMNEQSRLLQAALDAQNSQQQQQQEWQRQQQELMYQQQQELMQQQQQQMQNTSFGDGAMNDGLGGLSERQTSAIQNNISPDTVARAQITGEIDTLIMDAEKSMERLKTTLKTVTEYAGCDERGNNCTGPKRVKRFKELANEFFDPYQDVLDQLYQALILAQSVGVDLSQIYYLLNDSCSLWGKYTCNTTLDETSEGEEKVLSWPRYNQNNCNARTGLSERYGTVKGGHECFIGQTIPPEDDATCTLFATISPGDDEEVKRGYLYAEAGDVDEHIRVGCASAALQHNVLFKNMKSNNRAKVDIEILQRIVDQDAPEAVYRTSRGGGTDTRNTGVSYCALTDSEYTKLQKYVTLGALPKSGICVRENKLNALMGKTLIGQQNWESLNEMAKKDCTTKEGAQWSEYLNACFCEKDEDKSRCNEDKSKKQLCQMEQNTCKNYSGEWTTDTDSDCESKCKCSNIQDEDDRKHCEDIFGG